MTRRVVKNLAMVLGCLAAGVLLDEAARWLWQSVIVGLGTKLVEVVGG